MNLKEALTRIEELERKVRELEARPAQQVHYHYGVPQPQYFPVIPQPSLTPPFQPHWPQVTLGGAAG